MHEWAFRAAAVALTTIAYAINVWLFAVACLALATWYGWHRYTYGHVPGADPDHLDQTARGDLTAALVAALLAGVPAIAIPIGLFALGLGYPVVIFAVAVAAGAGAFFYFQRR